MKKLVRAASFAAALMAVASLVHAEDSGRRGGWLLQADLDYGGDDLATVSFTDGDSQHVKAGQGVSLAVGGYFHPVESAPFELQAIFGYKFVTTAANNADIKVTRTTFQFNGIYRFANAWYVGGGITHHMSPELNGDGFFEDIEFDDATGFTAEVGWRWVALHYTAMDYSSPGFEDADASHFGLRLTYRFGASD